jgi:DNA-binding transcriptional regulator YdaS (Cro superfamily)
LSTIAACCAISGIVASMVGAGLRLLSVSPPTVSQFSSSP